MHFSCNVNPKILILISRPCSFLGTRKVQTFPKSINHEWKVPYVEGCEERAHFALPNEEIMTFQSGSWLVFLSMRFGTLVRDSICNTDMSWNWLITCVQVLHEALTGQHVGWRRALQLLDARFSETKPLKGMNARPCILLVDELDLLVTRNQSVLLLACLLCLRKCVLYVLTWMLFSSYYQMQKLNKCILTCVLHFQVLYNLFDWPSRPNSRLIVIGTLHHQTLPLGFFRLILMFWLQFCKKNWFSCCELMVRHF